MAIDVRVDRYVIGKGRFYFARYLADGSLEGFRFIGNVPAFTVTPSSDNLTHSSSMAGINVTDRDIQISSDLALAFTTDNMTPENKALWMGGSVDTLTVTAGTALTDTIVSKKGFLFPVGESPAQPSGAKDITVTSIVNGATTLVAGTDYTVNGKTGMIYIVPTGGAVDGTIYTVTYNVAASTRDQVRNKARTITGAVKFVSDNPDTGAGIVNEEHYIGYCRLSPDGDWSLIGEDWQSFGFTGSIIQQYDGAGNPIDRHIITPITT